jgi:hypothetical protein
MAVRAMYYSLSAQWNHSYTAPATRRRVTGRIMFRSAIFRIRRS